MAFNPFGVFRKHQKVLLVGLTIATMIIFVFSFGPGDLFQTLLGYIGAGSSTGEEVTELYGQTLTEGDLDKTRRARELANGFLLGTVYQQVMGGRNATRALDKARTTHQNLSEQAPNKFDYDLLFRSEQQRSMNLQFLGFAGVDPNRIRAEIYQSARNDLKTLAQMRERNPKAFQEEDQREIWSALVSTAAFQMWIALPQGFLLGGSPLLDDLLDFRVWLHQADELGIRLTEGDVRQLVNTLAGGRDLFEGQPFEQSEVVLETLRGANRRSEVLPHSSQELLQAVTDEFRAALAQEALLGQGPGLMAYRGDAGIDRSPATPTPAEYLAFFRKMRTTVKVALLPVPADAPGILDQVQGTPSGRELDFLYDKYKDAEPDPGQREPGFKEPRKVLVEYVRASGKDPYYQNLAQEVTKVEPAALALTAPLLPVPSGGGVAAVAAGLTWPLAHDPLRERYEEYRTRARIDAEDGLGLGFDPDDQAGQTRLVIGQMLAAAGPRTTPLGLAPAAVATRGLYAKAKARVVSAAWLAGWQPGLAALGQVAPVAERIQSYDRAKSWLSERYAARRASDFLIQNLNALAERIQKNKNRPAKAQEEIQKGIADYHLKQAKMESPRDRFTILEAPAIKEMSKALGEGASRTLAEDLFGMRPGQPLQVGIYEPERLNRLDADPTQVLFWRTEDRGARERPFAEVRDQVVAAWKLEKARPLAKKKAQEIAKEAEAKTWVTDASQREDEIKDFLNSQAVGDKKAFVLDNVARLVRPPQPLMGRQMTYQAYRVPEDQRENLRYQPADLAEKLTELQKPGDATVIADAPARTFYVAVLLARDPQTLTDFYRVYEHAKDTESVLWDSFLNQRQADYREAVLLRLRKEAGEVDEDGQFVVPEAVRERANAAARER